MGTQFQTLLIFLFFPLVTAQSETNLFDGSQSKPQIDKAIARKNRLEIRKCDKHSECILVPFSDCGFAGKTTINKKHLQLYKVHSEWQKEDESNCASMGAPGFNSNLAKSQCLNGFCTLLPLELSLRDLVVCTQDSDCIIVPHQHCCGSTKLAINRKYKSFYEQHTGLNKTVMCNLLAGACLDDSTVVESACEEKKCKLKWPKVQSN